MTEITLFGPPNSGKSSLFNALTHSHEHVGNWAGKTVKNASKEFSVMDRRFLLKDVPGSYSIFKNSDDEQEAIKELLNPANDITLLILDASSLTLSLALLFSVRPLVDNLVVFINLADEAAKSGITIDRRNLEMLASCPVVVGSVRQKRGLSELKERLYSFERQTYKFTGYLDQEKFELADKDRLYEQLLEQPELQEEFLDQAKHKALDTRAKVATPRQKRTSWLDKLFLNRRFGLLSSLLTFSLLLYITVIGANYPSQWLATGFDKLLALLRGQLGGGFWPRLLTDGVLNTTFTVVSVMLPPMAIFFPLFAFFEELGILPRLAYNFDSVFSRFKAHGKTCLLMCMGVGCNASASSKSRIIGNERSREKALITNSFIPCNGRFPTIIAIARMFFGGSNIFLIGLYILLFIFLGILLSLIVIWLMSLFDSRKTALRDCSIIEMTPLRRPSARVVIFETFVEKTLKLLGRAVAVSLPFGALIFVLANTRINGQITLKYLVDTFDHLQPIFGLDGETFTAFVLAFPANEIVLPILSMSYRLGDALLDPSFDELYALLLENAWTLKTAVIFLVFSLTHWPCSTTLLTTYRETRSVKTTAKQFLIPTACAFTLALALNFILP